MFSQSIRTQLPVRAGWISLAIRAAILAVAVAIWLAPRAEAGCTSSSIGCTMLISGTIFPNTSSGLSNVVVTTSSVVQIVETGSPFKLIGQATIDSVDGNGDGSYSFGSSTQYTYLPPNPVQATLKLVIGCTTYALTCTNTDCASNGTPGSTSFVFTFDAEPVVQVVNLTGQDAIIGSVLSTSCGSTTGSTGSGSTSTGSSTVCPASLPNCDVAGVGVFDYRAIQAEKACMAMAHPPASCDVNGDGVVNAADLIALLRAYYQAQAQAIQSKMQINSAAQASSAATSTSSGLSSGQ